MSAPSIEPVNPHSATAAAVDNRGGPLSAGARAVGSPPQAIVKAIYHKNPYVRKITSLLLRVPRATAGLRRGEQGSPTVLANSFPKSGTHVLTQIVGALPGVKQYGTFLASMTSSFRFRQRSSENTLSFINSIVDGELVRGHLYFDPAYDALLARRQVIHYFIYRDPRDAVVSEAYYLREMNRWHRMSRHFKHLSRADAISLAINGLASDSADLNYRDIGHRFRQYSGWVKSPNVCAIRFEDLTSERRTATLQRMSEFFCDRCSYSVDRQALQEVMAAQMQPQASHTFRKGEAGSWRKHFSDVHKSDFKRVSGSLLEELDYESGSEW